MRQTSFPLVTNHYFILIIYETPSFLFKRPSLPTNIKHKNFLVFNGTWKLDFINYTKLSESFVN